jgi:hypothetical protein
MIGVTGSQSPHPHPTAATVAVFGSSVRALYTEDKWGRPDPVGSGVLAQFGRRVFLLTACHVLRECGDQPLAIAGDEEFVEVDSWFHSVAPNGSEPDALDVAFAELSEATCARLGAIRPIQPHQIDPDDERLPFVPYVGMGFPIKKTKLHVKERVVGASLVRVTGFAKPDALRKLGLSGVSHVAFSFDRKRTVMNGVLQPVIKPYGMSGGGVWRFDSAFGETSAGPSARLVGILTEFHENDIKAMIGTRIGVILEMIRVAFPDTEILLPQCKRGKIIPVSHPQRLSERSKEGMR